MKDFGCDIIPITQKQLISPKSTKEAAAGIFSVNQVSKIANCVTPFVV